MRNAAGDMIPLRALVADTETILGPLSITRYNQAQAAALSGSNREGFSTGEAIRALEAVAGRVLPEGYAIEWTGTTRQELEAGDVRYVFSAQIQLFTRLCINQRSVISPIEPRQTPRKQGGYAVIPASAGMTPENALGLPSLAVNLIRTLIRSENSVFLAENTYMGGNLMQLAGLCIVGVDGCEIRGLPDEYIEQSAGYFLAERPAIRRPRRRIQRLADVGVRNVPFISGVVDTEQPLTVFGEQPPDVAASCDYHPVKFVAFLAFISVAGNFAFDFPTKICFADVEFPVDGEPSFQSIVPKKGRIHLPGLLIDLNRRIDGPDKKFIILYQIRRMIAHRVFLALAARILFAIMNALATAVAILALQLLALACHEMDSTITVCSGST